MNRVFAILAGSAVNERALVTREVTLSVLEGCAVLCAKVV
jgi:hypothetical protein